MNIYTVSKTDLGDGGISSCEQEPVQILASSSEEKVIEIVPDRVTEKETSRYSLTLGGEFIGRIYCRSLSFYYAVLRGCYKSFNNLDSAEEWLVDSYYSLEVRPIEVEEHEGIIYVFRGNKTVGECHYGLSYFEWVVYAFPGSVRVYSRRFATEPKAIDFIVNLSLNPECDLYEYIVHLDGDEGFTSVRVKVDRRSHDWENCPAHFQKVSCKEYKFLEAIAISLGQDWWSGKIGFIGEHCQRMNL